jgi:CHAT domain-containing protein/tetratricopeptide (TPR) repeat protein
MAFLDRFRRKKNKEREEPRSRGQPPLELLEALESLPLEMALRLMSVRSERELMELLAEHPELMPLLEQMMVQVQGQEQALLLKAVDAFVNADSWAESRSVVEAHPELLTDEADALLAQLIEAQDDGRATRILEEHRRLLARCRAEGVDAAFDDQVFGREMVPEDVDTELLIRLLSVHSAQELMELVAEYPELMPVLEQMMRQAGGSTPSPTTPIRASGGLQTELAQVPTEVQQIVRQLAQPVTHSHQQVQRLRLFEQALAMVDRQRFPQLWAILQNDFANSLSQMPTGDRAENLERAIAAYTAALEVYTQADFPVEWAMIQTNLGNAYSERIRGDRAKNLERAFAAYTAALEVYTQADFPVQWATIQSNLGNAYRNRIRGDRAENLERAIGALNTALEVRTQAEFPADWAMTQNNLGAVYSERIRGDRAENLERAIAAYTAALEVYTQADFPTDWAAAQNNLGEAYRNRIRGDRAENLERAIAAYTAALEVHTRSDFPVQWAATQDNLGTAHAYRIRGDRAENLEQAIAAFTSALEVRTRADLPMDWATTQNNLGNALRERIRGDRAENLERAIAALTAALEVYKWAITQNNLGNAYVERIGGDRAENLERAIAAFTAALEVRTCVDFPIDWAMTQNNLGNVYVERIEGDRAENLEQAIAAFSATLEVYTRTDLPVQWAATQNNLGAVYSERIRGDRAENLERAIAAYTAALEVRTRTDFPVQWAKTQNNLAAAYSRRIRGDRAENLERAIAAFQNSITASHELGIRDAERRVAHNLGNIHYNEGQWECAYAAFDIAIAALETLRTEYFTEEAKTRLAEENALLYARMTDTCLGLGRPQEALERAEAGKGRLFLDQLGYDDFPIPTLLPAQQLLLKKERSLINELRGLEHAIRTAPDETRRREFVAQQGEKRGALDEVWAQLGPHAPDYVALRRGDPVKYDDLQALVDGFGTAAAFVEFYTLPDKIIVFVLRSGEQEPAVTQVYISQDQLRHHVQTYWREVVRYPRRGDIGQRWQELAKPLLGDVLPHLEGAELVYLVPHGLLHYLPLHALQVNGEYLIDRFSIAYAPSAAVLGRVIQRTAGMERTGNGRGALVLGYTPHEHERTVFEGEAMQVAEFFGTEAHLGQEANGALLQEKGVQHNTLHLSCHGFFDPIDPLASGLQLADGVLTARDIMGMKLNADLVTLSACQTALSDQQPGDELVGLTRALLYAGASSVLVTLWSVNAVAALELMGDFYGRLRSKDGAKVTSEAVALREAMLAMRKEREHPYYWAPFILVGDWR